MSDTFPPNGPTALTTVVPSYAYGEYSDDDDIQAFVAAYNEMAQQILNTLNGLNLPVYIGDAITGALLDWVAQGIYGVTRPLLPFGYTQVIGPFATQRLGEIEFGNFYKLPPRTFYETTDDVFKRILTWMFFKGDGFYFNTTWLKRRIMRFLTGPNGTDPVIDNTYQISVSYVGTQVNIRILEGLRTINPSGSALFGSQMLGQLEFAEMSTNYVNLPVFPLSPILKAALDAGILPLPFQYTYNIEV